MKKILVILIVFFISACVCFAEKESSICKAIQNELQQISISFNIYVNDLNEELLEIPQDNSNFESLKNLQDLASKTVILLFMLSDMLKIEFLHIDNNQLNPQAIVIIRKNIDAVNKHINIVIAENNKVLTSLDDILLIPRYERYADYLLKIEKLLRDLKIEFSSPVFKKKYKLSYKDKVLREQSMAE